MASEVAAKRRRILGAAGMATNQRLLAKVLRTLRDHADEEEITLTERWQLAKAVDSLWSECGAVVPLEVRPGKIFQLPIVNFGVTLRKVIEDNSNFANVLLSTWYRQPCTKADPWHLVVYCDEFTPGQVLRQDNQRKQLAMQATIKEFGNEVIKLNAAWIPILTLRHVVAREIEGNESYVFRMLRNQWFITNKLRDNGVVLPLTTRSGRYVVLYFALSNLIADGDALRMLLDLKGARGKVPCCGCINVVSQDDELPSADFVSLNCNDPTKFVLATSADVREKAAALVLNYPTMGIGRFRNLETALGMKYNPKGILFDPSLEPYISPIEILTFDQMHILLSDGVAQDLVSWTLLFLKDIGSGWDELNAIMQADWRFCHLQKAGGRAIRTSFNKHREKAFREKKTFSCGASEALAILPIFLYFLERIVRVKYGSAVDPVLDCFRSFCCVVALVKEGKSGNVMPRDLLKTIITLADKYALAFPDAKFKPKNHWLYHIPWQMLRDNFVIDCFVGERLNRNMKACSQNVTKHGDLDPGFELAVLKRTLVHYFSSMEDAVFGCALYKASPCDSLTNLFGDSNVAASMVWKGSWTHKGDVLILNEQPYRVAGCICITGSFYIAGTRFKFVKPETISASRWRPDGAEWQLASLEGAVVRYAVAWFEDGCDIVVLAL